MSTFAISFVQGPFCPKNGETSIDLFKFDSFIALADKGFPKKTDGNMLWTYFDAFLCVITTTTYDTFNQNVLFGLQVKTMKISQILPIEYFN